VSLRAGQEILFCEWEQKCRANGEKLLFVRDGVCCEDDFTRQRPRILFLLKEANDRNQTLRDLCEVIVAADRTETWDDIARWTHGIRTLPTEMAWTDVVSIASQDKPALLHSIGAMNLKKTAGGSVMEHEPFDKFVKSYAEEIARQFRLYEADVAICCGSPVAWGIRHALGDTKDQPWSHTRRGIPYYRYSTGKYIISYVHPEARVPDYIKYYAIVDACREILGAKAT